MTSERYKQEYVNSEVSEIIDTYENETLTAETIVDRLNQQQSTIERLIKQLYYTQSNITYEHSSNITEDLENLKDNLETVYGVEL